MFFQVDKMAPKKKKPKQSVDAALVVQTQEAQIKVSTAADNAWNGRGGEFLSAPTTSNTTGLVSPARQMLTQLITPTSHSSQVSETSEINSLASSVVAATDGRRGTRTSDNPIKKKKKKKKKLTTAASNATEDDRSTAELSRKDSSNSLLSDRSASSQQSAVRRRPKRSWHPIVPIYIASLDQLFTEEGTSTLETVARLFASPALMSLFLSTLLHVKVTTRTLVKTERVRPLKQSYGVCIPEELEQQITIPLLTIANCAVNSCDVVTMVSDGFRLAGIRTSDGIVTRVQVGAFLAKFRLQRILDEQIASYSAVATESAARKTVEESETKQLQVVATYFFNILLPNRAAGRIQSQWRCKKARDAFSLRLRLRDQGLDPDGQPIVAKVRVSSAERRKAGLLTFITRTDLEEIFCKSAYLLPHIICYVTGSERPGTLLQEKEILLLSRAYGIPLVKGKRATVWDVCQVVQSRRIGLRPLLRDAGDLASLDLFETKCMPVSKFLQLITHYEMNEVFRSELVSSNCMNFGDLIGDGLFNLLSGRSEEPFKRCQILDAEDHKRSLYQHMFKRLNNSKTSISKRRRSVVDTVVRVPLTAFQTDKDLILYGETEDLGKILTCQRAWKRKKFLMRRRKAAAKIQQKWLRVKGMQLFRQRVEELKEVRRQMMEEKYGWQTRMLQRIGRGYIERFYFTSCGIYSKQGKSLQRIARAFFSRKRARLLLQLKRAQFLYQRLAVVWRRKLNQRNIERANCVNLIRRIQRAMISRKQLCNSHCHKILQQKGAQIQRLARGMIVREHLQVIRKFFRKNLTKKVVFRWRNFAAKRKAHRLLMLTRLQSCGRSITTRRQLYEQFHYTQAVRYLQSVGRGKASRREVFGRKTTPTFQRIGRGLCDRLEVNKLHCLSVLSKTVITLQNISRGLKDRITLQHQRYYRHVLRRAIDLQRVGKACMTRMNCNNQKNLLILSNTSQHLQKSGRALRVRLITNKLLCELRLTQKAQIVQKAGRGLFSRIEMGSEKTETSLKLLMRVSEGYRSRYQLGSQYNSTEKHVLLLQRMLRGHGCRWAVNVLRKMKAASVFRRLCTRWKAHVRKRMKKRSKFHQRMELQRYGRGYTSRLHSFEELTLRSATLIQSVMRAATVRTKIRVLYQFRLLRILTNKVATQWKRFAMTQRVERRQQYQRRKSSVAIQRAWRFHHANKVMTQRADQQAARTIQSAYRKSRFRTEIKMRILCRKWIGKVRTQLKRRKDMRMASIRTRRRTSAVLVQRAWRYKRTKKLIEQRDETEQEASAVIIQHAWKCTVSRAELRSLKVERSISIIQRVSAGMTSRLQLHILFRCKHLQQVGKAFLCREQLSRKFSSRAELQSLKVERSIAIIQRVSVGMTSRLRLFILFRCKHLQQVGKAFLCREQLSRKFSSRAELQSLKVERSISIIQRVSVGMTSRLQLHILFRCKHLQQVGKAFLCREQLFRKSHIAADLMKRKKSTELLQRNARGYQQRVKLFRESVSLQFAVDLLERIATAYKTRLVLFESYSGAVEVLQKVFKAHSARTKCARTAAVRKDFKERGTSLLLLQRVGKGSITRYYLAMSLLEREVSEQTEHSIELLQNTFIGFSVRRNLFNTFTVRQIYLRILHRWRCLVSEKQKGGLRNEAAACIQRAWLCSLAREEFQVLKIQAKKNIRKRRSVFAIATSDLHKELEKQSSSSAIILQRIGRAAIARSRCRLLQCADIIHKTGRGYIERIFLCGRLAAMVLAEEESVALRAHSSSIIQRGWKRHLRLVENQKNHSAVNIQRLWRGHSCSNLVRSLRQLRHISSICIQMHTRTLLSQQYVTSLQEAVARERQQEVVEQQKFEEKQQASFVIQRGWKQHVNFVDNHRNSSVTNIQRVWRGYSGRNRVKSLRQLRQTSAVCIQMYTNTVLSQQFVASLQKKRSQQVHRLASARDRVDASQKAKNLKQQKAADEVAALLAGGKEVDERKAKSSNKRMEIIMPPHVQNSLLPATQVVRPTVSPTNVLIKSEEQSANEVKQRSEVINSEKYFRTQLEDCEGDEFNLIRSNGEEQKLLLPHQQMSPICSVGTKDIPSVPPTAPCSEDGYQLSDELIDQPIVSTHQSLTDLESVLAAAAITTVLDNKKYLQEVETLVSDENISRSELSEQFLQINHKVILLWEEQQLINDRTLTAVESNKYLQEIETLVFDENISRSELSEQFLQINHTVILLWEEQQLVNEIHIKEKSCRQQLTSEEGASNSLLANKWVAVVSTQSVVDEENNSRVALSSDNFKTSNDVFQREAIDRKQLQQTSEDKIISVPHLNNTSYASLSAEEKSNRDALTDEAFKVVEVIIEEEWEEEIIDGEKVRKKRNKQLETTQKVLNEIISTELIQRVGRGLLHRHQFPSASVPKLDPPSKTQNDTQTGTPFYTPREDPIEVFFCDLMMTAALIVLRDAAMFARDAVCLSELESPIRSQLLRKQSTEFVKLKEIYVFLRSLRNGIVKRPEYQHRLQIAVMQTFERNELIKRLNLVEDYQNQLQDTRDSFLWWGGIATSETERVMASSRKAVGEEEIHFRGILSKLYQYELEDNLREQSMKTLMKNADEVFQSNSIQRNEFIDKAFQSRDFGCLEIAKRAKTRHVERHLRHLISSRLHDDTEQYYRDIVMSDWVYNLRNRIKQWNTCVIEPVYYSCIVLCGVVHASRLLPPEVTFRRNCIVTASLAVAAVSNNISLDMDRFLALAAVEKINETLDPIFKLAPLATYSGSANLCLPLLRPSRGNSFCGNNTLSKRLNSNPSANISSTRRVGTKMLFVTQCNADSDLAMPNSTFIPISRSQSFTSGMRSNLRLDGLRRPKKARQAGSSRQFN